MSVAESIRPLYAKLNRLAIQDSDGKEWKYAEGRPASNADAEVQVEYGAVNLIRDSIQEAVLRQMAPGLPKKIVVQFGSSAGQGCGGTYEFEQE